MKDFPILYSSKRSSVTCKTILRPQTKHPSLNKNKKNKKYWFLLRMRLCLSVLLRIFCITAMFVYVKRR